MTSRACVNVCRRSCVSASISRRTTVPTSVATPTPTPTPRSLIHSSTRLYKSSNTTGTKSKMVKPDSEVISEFNEIVNMSASELEEWLKTESSESAGWGGESGETVGHESGRNIVDILKRNPQKKEDKYTEDDIAHMRKVVSYCKRHLAQEAKMKETKSKEELEQTKSVRSLRNWGHDPLK